MDRMKLFILSTTVFLIDDSKLVANTVANFVGWYSVDFDQKVVETYWYLVLVIDYHSSISQKTEHS